MKGCRMGENNMERAAIRHTHFLPSSRVAMEGGRESLGIRKKKKRFLKIGRGPPGVLVEERCNSLGRHTFFLLFHFVLLHSQEVQSRRRALRPSSNHPPLLNSDVRTTSSRVAARIGRHRGEIGTSIWPEV